jgi:hypothetical protein
VFRDVAGVRHITKQEKREVPRCRRLIGEIAGDRVTRAIITRHGNRITSIAQSRERRANRAALIRYDEDAGVVGSKHWCKEEV